MWKVWERCFFKPSSLIKTRVCILRDSLCKLLNCINLLFSFTYLDWMYYRETYSILSLYASFVNKESHKKKILLNIAESSLNIAWNLQMLSNTLVHWNYQIIKPFGCDRQQYYALIPSHTCITHVGSVMIRKVLERCVWEDIISYQQKSQHSTS